MCYICKQERIRHRHCGCRNEDTDELHKKEMKEAFLLARSYLFTNESDPQNIIEKLGIDKLLDQPRDDLLQEVTA